MSHLLNDLSPRFRPLAIELVARCAEAGYPVFIVCTKRTAQEQAAAVTNGFSWVSHSLHQDGLAIDVAPYEIFMLHGEKKLHWDANDPVWQVIGAIGKKLGLVWGGDWKQRDMGHFQLAKVKNEV